MASASLARACAGGALLIVGILAVAFNQRAAIASLPPVFPELRSAAGLSVGTEAALAAVPVLCFGACSGLAPVLARKVGEERALGFALILLATGLGLRAAAPAVLLFPGTVLASGAIAVMNVLLPSLIKRRRPEQAGLLIGLYLMLLTGGAVLASALAVPVFDAAGKSSLAVRLILGMWAVPALAALLAWLPQLRSRTSPRASTAGGSGGSPPRASAAGGSRRSPPRASTAGGSGGSPPRASTAPARAGRSGILALARHALAWQVAAFMGLQSLSYYTSLSWFPTMFRDHGIGAAAAGNLLALMTAGNAISGLIVPMIAQRTRDQRLLAVASVAAIMIGLVGSAFAPNAAAVGFVALLGLGQGASFGLSVFLFTARAADGAGAAALSGFSQGTGYLVAAAGPLLIGYLHTVSGGWAWPVAALLACAAGQLVSGLLAGRALTLPVGYAVIPDVSPSHRASGALQDGRDLR